MMSKMHHHEFLSCNNFIVELHIRWKNMTGHVTSIVIARGWDRKIAESLGCKCFCFNFSQKFRTNEHTDTWKQVNCRYLKQNKTKPHHLLHIINTQLFHLTYCRSNRGAHATMISAHFSFFFFSSIKSKL